MVCSSSSVPTKPISTDLEPRGPIVRIGPNTLSINTIGALKEIYGSRKANVQKSDWYRTLDSGSGAFSTHSEIDKSKHAFRRRVLEHAFSESALRSVEPFVLENVRIWCNCLGSSEEAGPVRAGEWTPAKNMTEWSNYLSYDIMGDLTFGKKFECMKREEHRYVPGLMMRATEFVYVVRDRPSIHSKKGRGILSENNPEMLTKTSPARLPSIHHPHPPFHGHTGHGPNRRLHGPREL
jgi:cytochrome P450